MSIEFIPDGERAAVAALAALADANPFLPGRIDLERRALGRRFTATGEVWRVEASLAGVNPNLPRPPEQAGRFARPLRARLAAGARPGREDLLRYEALVRYLLFARYENAWLELAQSGERGEPTTGRVDAFDRFAFDVDALLRVPDLELP